MDLILPNASADDGLQNWASRAQKSSDGRRRLTVAKTVPDKLSQFAQKVAHFAEEKGREAKKAAAVKKRKPPQPRTLLGRFVPITQWLPKYRWHQSFFVDLCAGLTAAVFSIPTGIAHAGICGVAPVYGLYTVIFPTFFYMFFGHSRHNALGGFAILSLMTRAAIERVDRMLVNDMAMVIKSNASLANGSLPNSTADDFTQSLLNASTLREWPVEELERDNHTKALLMNGTDFEGGHANGLMDAMADESSLNTSLIIAELNVSSDEPSPSSTNNPLLNDPIQLSVAKPEASGNASGSDSEIGKRMREIRPIHIATLILFMGGIFQLLMGIFRLDFLSCYFSEQVMSGFVLGGCVHVFFSQLGDLLGIQHLLPSRSGRGYLYDRLLDIYAHLAFSNSQTVLISGCSVFFLLFTQQIFEPWLADAFEFPIPYELLLVIIGITATNFADLSNRHNITVVGNIPTNFPTPSLPRFELVPFVFFDAVSIAVTAVAIHLTVVKIVENRYHYKINSCQELYSLGLSGICSSALFPVFPITSIFARTLIGDANENCTQMTICFSSLSLLTVILYIGPALEYLPKCILASIVIVSVCSSFSKFHELRELWPLFKIDFAIFLVSFLLTVCYDMAEGLTLSALFSAFTIVVRDQWPKWHFLTHDEELNEYKEVPKQFLHQVAEEGHAFIIRYDAPLIFTSVHKFMKVLLQSVKRWDQLSISRKCLCCSSSTAAAIVNTAAGAGDNFVENTLIIDCSGFPYVDFLGLRTLKKVYKEFSDKNVVVKFAAPKVHLMRMFRETDFHEVVPEENVFQTVKQAANSCHRVLPTIVKEKVVAVVNLLDSDEEEEISMENSFY